jgi:tRNA/rRNA methyltransferase
MLPEQQSRLAVVLVRARNPSNIGAVARAMHDFGFSDLRVVNDYPVPFEAARSAVHASAVLNRATQPSTLAGAVADCTLVLGTTAVGDRVLEHPLYTLAQAVPLVQAHLDAYRGSKVALLFGSEKTGLSNAELSHCHALVTIPMNTHTAERHLSMNLGQAAAVCLYAIAQSGAVPTPPQPPPASSGDLERLTVLLQEVFDRSGYARRNPGHARELNVRRIVRRMTASHEDAAVWSGILRQILHALPSAPATDL